MMVITENSDKLYNNKMTLNKQQIGNNITCTHTGNMIS